MSSRERVELAINKIMHFVTGWLQIKVIEKANEGNMDSYQRREARSGVGAAIERLEENLN
jgi:hypothetical protein